MIIALIISAVFGAIVSGIFKAVCDLSEEGKLKGNPLFWHKNVAWRNKWKDGDKTKGEKFFGSSRWFVMFTDAWHLFGFVFRLCFALTYLCVGLLSNSSYYWLFSGIVVYIIFAASFHIFHTYKILRR